MVSHVSRHIWTARRDGVVADANLTTKVIWGEKGRARVPLRCGTWNFILSWRHLPDPCMIVCYIYSCILIINPRKPANDTHGKSRECVNWTHSHTWQSRHADTTQHYSSTQPTCGEHNAYEYKWQSKKAIVPPLEWTENYKSSTFNAINQKNYLEYITWINETASFFHRKNFKEKMI